MENISENKKIILFDGVCNLCNSAVNYVIENDPNDVFRFASLQSDAGIHLMEERGIDPDAIDSIILIEPGIAYYKKSTAALEISKDLSGSISYLRFFSVLPESFRDVVYDFIANHRYKWFGKKDACMIPTPELKAKFL